MIRKYIFILVKDQINYLLIDNFSLLFNIYTKSYYLFNFMIEFKYTKQKSFNLPLTYNDSKNIMKMNIIMIDIVIMKLLKIMMIIITLYSS